MTGLATHFGSLSVHLRQDRSLEVGNARKSMGMNRSVCSSSLIFPEPLKVYPFAERVGSRGGPLKISVINSTLGAITGLGVTSGKQMDRSCGLAIQLTRKLYADSALVLTAT